MMEGDHSLLADGWRSGRRAGLPCPPRDDFIGDRRSAGEGSTSAGRRRTRSDSWSRFMIGLCRNVVRQKWCAACTPKQIPDGELTLEDDLVEAMKGGSWCRGGWSGRGGEDMKKKRQICDEGREATRY